MDISKEKQETLDLYGPDVKTPGSFAANCVLARKMCESGVRFVQLYHGGGGQGWDTHGSSDSRHVQNGQQIDKPIAGRSPT